MSGAGEAAGQASHELEAEAVELLRDLIRIDTSNPPGNETAAAEHLAAYLAAAGVTSELVGPDPERLNLVARVEGGDGPSLMLMAHTDVVPAPDTDWTSPPFGAELRNGAVYGRGAGDMKGELAARAVALAALARSGETPPGDVLLVAEADEESNTFNVGMSWLVRERPDLRCDYALNESGGWLLPLADGRKLVTISIGEKQVGSIRLRFFGKAAHASVPSRADNAVGKAADAVERLLDMTAPPGDVPSVSRALHALGVSTDDEAAMAAWGHEQNEVLGEMLPVMIRLTVTPTGLRTYEPANVIPPYADVVCDVRALPGQDADDVREHVAQALGTDEGYELEFREPLEGGTESPIDTPLYELCQAYVSERVPGATLFPVISPGFSDSYWVRKEQGTVAYGFAPVFTMDLQEYLRGHHGADEALAVADLVEMTEFSLRAARGA
jgi:acetylornithine deacetylase/succinyl-diaminopimelate desuccinylase-like protein